MNIYEECPTLENDRFLIRLTTKEDCVDLLEVYSDKNALPFFNSDNCHGDNFYYATKERMSEAIDFWEMLYENGWFVRLSIVDKVVSKVIGTVKVCLRVSEDVFNNMGILRLDVKSEYEKERFLYDIFSIVTPHMNEMLGCHGTITKVPIYAIERINAIQRAGYTKSKDYLIGSDGFTYDGYWVAG